MMIACKSQMKIKSEPLMIHTLKIQLINTLNLSSALS